MEEALAIEEFDRVRQVQFVSPMMSSAQEGNIDKVFKSWQNAVFPESRLDNIKYLKKSSDAFKKYSEMDLRIVGM